jgi:hypothetical protein
MFKLCPFFPLPLYLVATGLRTIQFLFNSLLGYFEFQKLVIRFTKLQGSPLNISFESILKTSFVTMPLPPSLPPLQLPRALSARWCCSTRWAVNYVTGADSLRTIRTRPRENKVCVVGPVLVVVHLVVVHLVIVHLVVVTLNMVTCYRAFSKKSKKTVWEYQ